MKIISNSTLLLLISAQVFADEPITLMWNNRMPYLSYQNNQLVGLTGKITYSAFTRSKIPFKLAQTSTKRQLLSIKLNKEKVCATGWFKLKERMKFALYTRPIYQESMIVLTKKNNKLVRKHKSFKKLMSSKDLTLLIKQGYSYGKMFDREIIDTKNKIIHSHSTNEKMFSLLDRDRVDYILMAPEEAKHLILKSNRAINEFELINFKSLSYTNKRYIICSKNVSKKVIEKLNKFIPSI